MTPAPARRWITVQEAAEYVGLHPWTIRDRIVRGIIPAVRLGRAVRVDIRALKVIEVARIPLAKNK